MIDTFRITTPALNQSFVKDELRQVPATMPKARKADLTVMSV